MKKHMDVARLVVFILAGIGLYIYMGNAFAAQITESKDLIRMTPRESYQIWKMVNEIEKLWYSNRTGEVRPFKDSKIVKDQLIKLTKPYEELFPTIIKLLKARRDDQIALFHGYKEEVANTLRPIWVYATRAEKEKRKNGVVGMD